MGEKNIAKGKLLGKIAKIFLTIYTLALTGALAAALFYGPLKDPIRARAEIRVAQLRLREMEDEVEKLERERKTLILTIRNLQADAKTQQKTIEAFRQAGKDISFEKQIEETNQLVEKLNRERTVLIEKLGELQKELQALANTRAKEAGGGTAGAAPGMSDLIQKLEEEKANLQARLDQALKELEALKK